MGDDPSGASVLAKQSGITVAGQFVGRALEFAFLLVVTHLASASTYGAFTLGISVVAFVQGIASLNLHRSIDYFVPQHLEEARHGRARGVLVSVLLAGLAASLAGAGAVSLSAGWLADVFDDPALAAVLPVMSLAIPLLTLSQVVYYSFNSVKQVHHRMVVQNLVKPLGKLALAAGLLVGGWGLAGLVGAYVGSLVVTVVVGGGLLAWKVDWVRSTGTDYGSIRPVLSYSLPLALVGAIHATVGQVDFFVIGYFLPSADVGVYRIGFLLASNLLIVLASVKPIFKPMIAERAGDRDALRAHYRLATRWVAMLVLPIAITLALAARTYLTLLFTAEFAAADAVVTLLVLGYLVNAGFGPEGTMLEGLGHTRFQLLNTVVLVGTNAVLDVLLVPRLGIVGAAVGTAVAMSLAGLAGLAEILYLEGVHPYTRDFGKVVLAGLAAAAGGLPATMVLDGVVLAVVLPVVVAAVYLVALVLAGGFTEADGRIAAGIDGRLGVELFSRLTAAGGARHLREDGG